MLRAGWLAGVASKSMRWAQLIDPCWWSSSCQVPREAVPSLIGKKGANLSRIREESGALIDVPNNDGSNAKLVRTYIHTIPNEHHPPLPASRASLPALAAAGLLTRCLLCVLPSTLWWVLQKFLPVRIRANTNNAANGAAASPPEEQVRRHPPTGITATTATVCGDSGAMMANFLGLPAFLGRTRVLLLLLQVAKAKALILAHLNDWQKNNALEEVGSQPAS